MNYVYVVLSVSNKAEVDVCDVYENESDALIHASELAIFKSGQKSSWVELSPLKEELEDGSSRWILLETSKHLVAVLKKETNESFVAKPNPLNNIKPGNLPSDFDHVVSISYTAKDDSLDPNLPGGFNYSNKPVTVEFLLNFPYDVKTTDELTDHQQWALVLARISKRPNYSVLTTTGTFIQKSALVELKNKSVIGLKIRNGELNYLDQIRLDSMDNEKSSSSEESSEESEKYSDF